MDKWKEVCYNGYAKQILIKQNGVYFLGIYYPLFGYSIFMNLTKMQIPKK